MPEHEKSNRPPPSLFDFLPSVPSDDAPRPRGKKKGRRKKGSHASDAVAVPPTPEQDRALSAKPEEAN